MVLGTLCCARDISCQVLTRPEGALIWNCGTPDVAVGVAVGVRIDVTVDVAASLRCCSSSRCDRCNEAVGRPPNQLVAMHQSADCDRCNEAVGRPPISRTHRPHRRVAATGEVCQPFRQFPRHARLQHRLTAAGSRTRTVTTRVVPVCRVRASGWGNVVVRRPMTHPMAHPLTQPMTHPMTHLMAQPIG